MDPETLRLLGALRRMSQALDAHSKHLEHTVGLTVPRVLVLEALNAAPAGELSAGTLAAHVGLTQGTVTSILDRLEDRSLVKRHRASDDRRRVLVRLTARGRATLAAAPPLLQAHFVQALDAMPPRTRKSLLSSLERLADLMRAPPAAAQLPPVA